MTRTIRRRQLLKATLGLGGLTYASPFGWSMTPKVMASTPSFTDYKAMVCVFLYGGNDSCNMLIPADNTSFETTGRFGGTWLWTTRNHPNS